MKLFFVKDEPKEHDILAEFDDDESLKTWMKRLRGLGVPQDSLRYDVVKGLHESSEKPFGEHLIVEGVPPVDEGIEITYYFESVRSPADDEDAQADYYQLGFGVDVVEGQMLAKQEIQGPGHDGYNAIGTRLPFQTHSTGNPLLYNKNVYIEKEGKVTQFYSKINGVLFNQNLETLDVYANFHIKGNVGFKTGNLNSGSDIEIDGDVKAGFAIRSKKSILVKGVVEKNAIIEAGENIVIEGGISVGAFVKADGDIEIKFAQGSAIEAGGDVKVSSYLYDCEVLALGEFVCSGTGAESRGAVIGGLINGVKGIKLVSVGSQNARTTLITGVNHSKLQNYQKLRKEKAQLEDEMKRLVRKLPLDLLDPNFKVQFQALPQSEKRVCQQKISQIISHRSEISALGAQINQLEPEAMTQNVDASIQISKALFPDVEIVLCQQYDLVQERFESIDFRLNNDKIGS